jgi:exonuclease SbcD
MDLGLETPTFYAGSMQPVDFGEEGQEKGFMVFDIDARQKAGHRLGGSRAPRFEAVPARRFVTVDVKPKDMDPTAEVCAAIERAAICDAVVRVDVHVTAEQERNFRRPDAQRLLQVAHYVAGIRTLLPADRTGTTVPAGVKVDAASPLEALDLYFQSKQFEEDRRARLRRAAEDLMATAGLANA